MVEAVVEAEGGDPQRPTVRSLIADAQQRLAAAGVPSPGVDATDLLAHAWGLDRSGLARASVMGESADPHVVARFRALVADRARRIPLQHLTGEAHFRGLTLAVGPGVFVPRPETESIVDLAIADLAEIPHPVVVDLCSGSGAIAFAIAGECPTASVYAVELSEQAYAWSQRNHQALGDLTERVQLRHGDARTACAELAGQVDVVVCNPPYIPTGMVPIDPEVRDHDPEVALYGGSEDGLRIPLELADHAATLLHNGGLLIMEHADTQGDSLPTALRERGWSEVRDVLDLTGRPRFATARRA